MFLAHGYSAVSVDVVVKAVGGSKTNVYSQFGGKEGLFVAVVEDLCSNFQRDFLLLDLSGLDAASGLKLLGNTLLAILLQPQHVAFQRLITAESGRYPALGKAWFEDGPQRSRAFLAEFILTRQGAGELGNTDPMQAATLFHSMLVFDPVQKAMLGQRLDANASRQHVDAVVRLFMQGCAT